MTSSPVTPLEVHTPRQLESNSVRIGFSSPPSRHKVPTITSKLQECTFLVIPLCAAILLIFSIGGGLAYATSKEPLPKEAVIGVSIAFVILGVLFAMGCLKMYHSTHESHISRLEPARSAYKRVSECPRKLHNGMSRFWGPKQNDDFRTDLSEFLHKPLAESQEIHTSRHVELDDFGKRNKEPLTARSGIPNDRVMQIQRKQTVQEERHHGYQEPRQWNSTNGYLGHNSYPVRHNYAPPIPPNGDVYDGSHPQVITLPSQTSSIGHTPPHMVAKLPKPHLEGNYQKPSTYNPLRYGRYYGNHNGEPSQVNRYSYVASGTEAMSEQLCGQRLDLQTNIAVPPEDLGRDVFRDLYQTTNIKNLVYQITNLVGMPETQKDLRGDGLPILPRSSSKTQTTTAPIGSVDIEKSVPGATRASIQAPERRNKSLEIPPKQARPCLSRSILDRDNDWQLDPELAVNKPLLGDIAIASRDNGGGTSQVLESLTGENISNHPPTERTYGRSLTKRKS